MKKFDENENHNDDGEDEDDDEENDVCDDVMLKWNIFCTFPSMNKNMVTVGPLWKAREV